MTVSEKLHTYPSPNPTLTPNGYQLTDNAPVDDQDHATLLL